MSDIKPLNWTTKTLALLSYLSLGFQFTQAVADPLSRQGHCITILASGISLPGMYSLRVWRHGGRTVSGHPRSSHFSIYIHTRTHAHTHTISTVIVTTNTLYRPHTTPTYKQQCSIQCYGVSTNDPNRSLQMKTITRLPTYFTLSTDCKVTFQSAQKKFHFPTELFHTVPERTVRVAERNVLTLSMMSVV